MKRRDAVAGAAAISMLPPPPRAAQDDAGDAAAVELRPLVEGAEALPLRPGRAVELGRGRHGVPASERTVSRRQCRVVAPTAGALGGAHRGLLTVRVEATGLNPCFVETRLGGGVVRLEPGDAGTMRPGQRLYLLGARGAGRMRHGFQLAATARGNELPSLDMSLAADEGGSLPLPPEVGFPGAPSPPRTPPAAARRVASPPPRRVAKRPRRDLDSSDSDSDDGGGAGAAAAAAVRSAKRRRQRPPVARELDLPPSPATRQLLRGVAVVLDGVRGRQRELLAHNVRRHGGVLLGAPDAAGDAVVVSTAASRAAVAARHGVPPLPRRAECHTLDWLVESFRYGERLPRDVHELR